MLFTNEPFVSLKKVGGVYWLSQDSATKNSSLLAQDGVGYMDQTTS